MGRESNSNSEFLPLQQLINKQQRLGGEGLVKEFVMHGSMMDNREFRMGVSLQISFTDMEV